LKKQQNLFCNSLQPRVCGSLLPPPRQNIYIFENLKLGQKSKIIFREEYRKKTESVTQEQEEVHIVENKSQRKSKRYFTKNFSSPQI